MLPFELSQTDLDTVKIERKNHSCPRVRTRLWILWLLHQGASRGKTAELASCAPNSVTAAIAQYNSGGLKVLMAPMKAVKKRHFLKGKFKKVRRALLKASIHTVQQAREFLAEKFGYRSSWESVRRLLHRLGLSYRKINPFPGNPKKFDHWQAEQKKWVKYLNSLYERAIQGEIDFVFADAAHFVHGKCGAYLWSDGPRYKATGSGRYRLNVYGAYDPVSNRLLSLYGERNVNANFVVEFLHYLRDNHYPDLSRTIHFMLDNARYQHCNYVKQVAEELNICLEFQPSYSPNLNLIERAWKYFKAIVGRSYCTTKEEFNDRIVSIVENTDDECHQENFKSLLTMNFQIYTKSQVLGC